MTRIDWKDVCPYCGSGNTQGVDGMLPEWDGRLVRFFIECLNCTMAWLDVYEKAFQESSDGYDLNDEEVNIVRKNLVER
jgi:formate dehydrogenase maturation protein FdhE